MLQFFTCLQYSINVKKVRDIEKPNTLIIKGSTKTFNDLIRASWKFVPKLTMKLILVNSLAKPPFSVLRDSLNGSVLRFNN